MAPKLFFFAKPAALVAPLLGVLAVGAATAALAYMFVKATEEPAKQPKEGEYFG